MQNIDLKVLLEAGTHFGHKTNKWHPSADKFIYKAVGDIHIIDLAITKKYLEKAQQEVYDASSKGKEVLFVGTKRQASSIVKKHAQEIGAPYVTSRWIGGFITNWQEVRKNIDKLNKLETNLKDKAKMAKFVKKERMLMDRKRGKLEAIYGGIRSMDKKPDMLFVVDIKKENTAILEANQNDIPIVGIVDTNSNASIITYPIPANDDAVGSISYIIGIIAQAYKEGKEAYLKGKAKEELKKKAEEESIKIAQEKKRREDQKDKVSKKS